LAITDFIAYYSFYLICTVALNLQFGCAGIPNFGLSLSVAGGAFAVGYLPGRLAVLLYMQGSNLDFVNNNTAVVAIINAKLGHDPVALAAIFGATLTLSILTAGFLGYVSAFPAIRLRADYLVMTLIAMAEAIRVIGNYYPPIAGGTLGVQIPDLFAFFGDFRSIGAAMFCLAVAIVLFLVTEKALKSPFGRLLRAIRDEETTAESVSKDTNRIKMTAMILGSVIAAFAGVLFALYTNAVVAQAFTRADWTFWPFLMVLVGGAGNNKGAAAGAFSVVLARRAITVTKHSFQFLLPFDAAWLEPMLLGVVLILVMMFRPQGIIPERPMTTMDHETDR
jgi:branched-chain amino acid transport system permease protein